MLFFKHESVGSGEGFGRKEQAGVGQRVLAATEMRDDDLTEMTVEEAERTAMEGVAEDGVVGEGDAKVEGDTAEEVADPEEDEVSRARFEELELGVVGHTVDVVTFWQGQFGDFVKELEAEGKTISKRQFEFLEQGYAEDWKIHQRILDDVQAAHPERDRMTETAESELPFVWAIRPMAERTLEVQAGRFYSERQRALRQKVAEDESEQGRKNLKTLDGFYGFVRDHIEDEYTTIGGMSRQEAEEYYRSRQARHDALIEQLNGLNRMAEEYGTKRFTARDFWTSKGENGNKAVEEKMLCDREQVEMYCRMAFRNKYAEAERKQRLQRELLR